MNSNFKHKTNCRICQQSNLVKILDLGLTPLANAFLEKEDLGRPEPRFPLALYFCQNCKLLQLLDVVNPEILFRHYYYLTSTSKPLAEHFIQLANDLVKRFAIAKNDLVVEIGGNDAVLLESIKDRARVLNIEPAENIARLSREKRVETIEQFFTRDLAKKILTEHGPAKVIIASNVFAHIDDLENVLAGAEILMDRNGVFVIEVHWLANLLGLVDIGGFDQIYHEHLSYFSLMSLQALAKKMAFKIFDVRPIPIHGRSLQVYFGKDHQPLSSVNEFLKQEEELGLDKTETYLDFAKKVEENKKDFKNLILELRKENKKIAGYGAPAKGNTLLNYFDINDKILDFIIDDSPLKQGCYTPGTHIPIFSRDKLLEEKIDYLLLLAWNYAESIFKKEQKLRERGVKFIVPVPKAKIIV